MKVQGIIKTIKSAQTFGASGFRKRELIVVTQEQYPQPILIEFVQDKCELLDKFGEGQEVEVSINLRGREWINPQGESVYFNTIQGWRIEPLAYAKPADEKMKPSNTSEDNEPDDLPF